MVVSAPDTMSISEAAAATGLTAHTLRYYERAGLMASSVDRDHSSSHRRYTEQDIGWITMLTRLRGTGMPISAVREYAELVRAGEGNEAARLALLQEHRERVLLQLEETAEHLAAIDRKIDLYTERVKCSQ
jgi:DNA-binding transcriptional MerR regulator